MFQGALLLVNRDIAGSRFGTFLDRSGLLLIQLATRPSIRLGIGHVSSSRIPEDFGSVFGGRRFAALAP